MTMAFQPWLNWSTQVYSDVLQLNWSEPYTVSVAVCSGKADGRGIIPSFVKLVLVIFHLYKKIVVSFAQQKRRVDYTRLCSAFSSYFYFNGATYNVTITQAYTQYE